MKPVVSSLVALAIALAPLSAMAAKPNPHHKPHAAKVQKHEKSAKADDKKEESPVVRVKATSKDAHGKKGVLKPVHHAHNVDLGGAGHKEPGVEENKKNSAIVPASMTAKIPTTKIEKGEKAEKAEKAEKKASSHASKPASSKDMPKLPNPNAGKPSKGGAEKGARSKPAASKSEAGDSSNDGETARDEELAELVARIRGIKPALSGKHEKNETKSDKADKADKAGKSDDDSEPQLLEKTEEPSSKASGASGNSSAKVAKNIAHTTKAALPASPPCVKEPVEIVRGPEIERFELTKCDGSVAPLAVERLSVLVRPGGAARPVAPLAELAKKPGAEIAHGVRRVDPRLAQRMQDVVDHFSKPNAPAKIFVISGYRPASVGSMHSTGRAIDFRVEGAKNEDVVAFCKTLNDTGCGFYPNSSFVHIDVRDPGAGHVTWIDASGPGETPRYVTTWPPPSVAARHIEKASANHGPETSDAEEGEKLLRARRPLDREAAPESVDEHPADVEK